MWKRCLLSSTVLVTLWLSHAMGGERWSATKAADWYRQQPWLVGSNFIPSTAINQLEMWQGETFDAETIDRELGWAQSLGFTSLRVFLHDLPWRDDRDGFLARVDQFLEIAQRHQIGVMFVLFDGVWDPDPQSGPQRRPRDGVHNSGWVQGPGRVILADPDRQDQLQGYVQDVLRRYRDDPRVQVWDLFNEPDNTNGNSYGPWELENKDAMAARLVRKSFAWAREVDPSQPLTVGVWHGPSWNELERQAEVQRAALELSDVISFHDYGNSDSIQRRIRELETYERPLLCTEFMARGNDSTFQTILPILKAKHIGAYCWGLVDGKTQTKYPWKTWKFPILGEPQPWHHDIFHRDGQPYASGEVQLIRQLTGVK